MTAAEPQRVINTPDDQIREPAPGKLANRPILEDCLSRIFAALDAAGIPYVLQDGDECLDRMPQADLDILIGANCTARQLTDIINGALGPQRGRIVRRNLLFFDLEIFARSHSVFVKLDFVTEIRVGVFEYATATRILGRRVQRNGFWVPSVEDEFRLYLLRNILKGRMDEKTIARLSQMVEAAPATCMRAVTHMDYLPIATRMKICSAVGNGDWSEIKFSAAEITARMRKSIATTHPLGIASAYLDHWRNRLHRLADPGGLSVVVLGPDGAGKSSLIDELEREGSLPFDLVQTRGFASPIHRLVDKKPKKTDTPHAFPPRGPILSLAKVAYWSLHALWSRSSLRRAKAANGLILYDRHFFDILVDPVRYRYAGPRWLLHAVKTLTPDPDVILLLDAPAEVLHKRKPELEMQERYRQRNAYLELVETLPQSVVLDATMRADAVLECARETVIDTLAARVVTDVRPIHA